MPTAAIGFQFGRHAMKRRTGWGFALSILYDLEPARLVDRSGLLARVFDRRGVAAKFHAYLKPVFFVRSSTDRNQKFTGLPTAGSADAEHVPQVAMGPLVERPQKPDAGLDGHDTA